MPGIRVADEVPQVLVEVDKSVPHPGKARLQHRADGIVPPGNVSVTDLADREVLPVVIRKVHGVEVDIRPHRLGKELHDVEELLDADTCGQPIGQRAGHPAGVRIGSQSAPPSPAPRRGDHVVHILDRKRNEPGAVRRASVAEIGRPGRRILQEPAGIRQ